jgi:type IV secretion system protein VirB4
MFDHASDRLQARPFQVYEFSALEEYPELLEPLLLHGVSAGMVSDTLTICVLDEAWRFIQHPTLRAYVQRALKTWRKQNAAMILATQAIEDFGQDDFLRAVIESCPTKLLLHNPDLDRARYADLLHLNDVEVDLVAGLRPRRQVLLKRQGLAKVLELMPPVLAERVASEKESVNA